MHKLDFSWQDLDVWAQGKCILNLAHRGSIINALAHHRDDRKKLNRLPADTVAVITGAQIANWISGGQDNFPFSLRRILVSLFNDRRPTGRVRKVECGNDGALLYAIVRSAQA